MTKRKHPPAVAVEDWPNYHVLATRCRHMGLEPTHPNLRLVDDPRRESLFGRMHILGLITPGEYQTALDMAGLDAAWKRRKGLPSHAIVNTLWRECKSEPSEFDAVDINAALDDEARLETIERALYAAGRELLNAGGDVYQWTLGLIRETYDDKTFYGAVEGVNLRTTKGELAKIGLRTLAEFFGVDDDEEDA